MDRIIPILCLAFYLAAHISCGKAPATTRSNLKQTSENLATKPASNDSSNRQDTATICDRIPQIKIIPFHGEKGQDPTYDTFMDLGEMALPCLIKRITDSTKVPDPRETLKFPETTIGDVAYFLIVDITKLGFAELLPAEVQNDYKRNGVWAYYAYVKNSKNRERLQTRLYEWYRQKYGKDARSLAQGKPS